MQVDEDKEARKMEAARAILAGRSFTEGDDDPFEGLPPKEIQEYIDKAVQGATRDDPFEVWVWRRIERTSLYSIEMQSCSIVGSCCAD